MINNKNKFILLIVQFTIGFAALLFGLSCIFNLLQFKRSVESLVPLDTIHAYINEHDDVSEQNINKFNEYNSVFRQLKEKNLVEKLAIFETMYVYDNPNRQDKNNESRLYILNDDSIGMSKLTLYEGSSDSFNTKIQSQSDTMIPILVSYALRDQYKVGNNYNLYYINSITQKNEEIEVKVVGVLGASVLFWNGGSTYISENINNNKEFILAPQFKDFESAMTFENNSLLKLPEIETREVSLEKITSFFEQNGLNIQYTTLQDEVDSYYESQKVVIISTITFAAILLLLSLLGSIGAILTNISTRYKDFGIYYALGLSKRNIIRLVLGEIILVFGASYLLSLAICKVLFTTLLVNESLSLSLSVTFIAFFIMILCIVLATIIPFLKLKRIEPIELIKGVNR